MDSPIVIHTFGTPIEDLSKNKNLKDETQLSTSKILENHLFDVWEYCELYYENVMDEYFKN